MPRAFVSSGAGAAFQDTKRLRQMIPPSALASGEEHSTLMGPTATLVRIPQLFPLGLALTFFPVTCAEAV